MRVYYNKYKCEGVALCHNYSSNLAHPGFKRLSQIVQQVIENIPVQTRYLCQLEYISDFHIHQFIHSLKKQNRLKSEIVKNEIGTSGRNDSIFYHLIISRYPI